MERPKFDAATPNLSLVRQLFLMRLRLDRSWEQLYDDNAEGFQTLVDFDPPRPGDREVFGRCLLDVFWQLVVEGILTPGKTLGNSMNSLPWFHRTAYGNQVIAAREYAPHDPIGFLRRLDSSIKTVDPTVRIYLEESLGTFMNGRLVASMVMLGVAAERVFDLVCETLEPALTDPRERANFSKLLERTSVRKRLDWVHEKLRKIEDAKSRPTDYPDRASVMIIAIYELMRVQRNDLGHPREDPPRPSRDQAYAHLQIFPTYYETAEALRAFLIAHKV